MWQCWGLGAVFNWRCVGHGGTTLTNRQRSLSLWKNESVPPLSFPLSSPPFPLLSVPLSPSHCPSWDDTAKMVLPIMAPQSWSFCPWETWASTLLLIINYSSVYNQNHDWDSVRCIQYGYVVALQTVFEEGILERAVSFWIFPIFFYNVSNCD